MTQVPPSAPMPGAGMRPHRGAMILMFGILSWVVCFIFGIVAWVMGNSDLRATRVTAHPTTLTLVTMDDSLRSPALPPTSRALPTTTCWKMCFYTIVTPTRTVSSMNLARPVWRCLPSGPTVLRQRALPVSF